MITILNHYIINSGTYYTVCYKCKLALLYQTEDIIYKLTRYFYAEYECDPYPIIICPLCKFDIEVADIRETRKI